MAELRDGSETRGEALDPIEEDVPSAFPRFVVRSFPLLGELESNCLYEAFRRRRTVHRRHRGGLAGRVPLWVQEGRGVMAGLWCALAISAMLELVLPALCFLLAIFVLFVYRRLLSLGRSRQLQWLSGVFRAGRAERRQAVDLWLAGTRGSDVARTLFLEWYERRWPAILWLVSIPYIIGMGMVFYFRAHEHIPGWFLILSLHFFLWQAFRSLLVSMATHICSKEVMPVLRYWEAEDASERAVAAGFRFLRLGALVLLAVAGYCLGGLFLSIAGSGYLPHPTDSPMRVFIGNHLLYIVLVPFLLVSGTVLGLLRGSMARRGQRRCEKAFAEADGVFERYMGRD